MKNYVFWDTTSCNPVKLTNVSDEHIASICRISTLLHADILFGLFFYPED
jgi:hypothetical protein